MGDRNYFVAARKNNLMLSYYASASYRMYPDFVFTPFPSYAVPVVDIFGRFGKNLAYSVCYGKCCAARRVKLCSVMLFHYFYIEFTV